MTTRDFAELMNDLGATRIELAPDRETCGRILAEGHLEVVRLRPDLTLTQCDLVYRDDERIPAHFQPGIFLSLLLSGEHRGVIEGRPIASTRAMVPTLVGTAHDASSRSDQQPGQHCRLVGLHVPAGALESRNEAEGGFGPLIEALQTGILHREIDWRPSLADHLLQLAQNPFAGSLGRLYAESRALAALVDLAALYGEQSRPPPRRTRGRDLAEEARQILETRLADPPGIGQLARMVGLNETDLRRCFKAHHGTTIVGYLRDRRLDLARSLVRERRLSIAEIAYRVGFSSPANFSTAYRQRFGLSPRRDLAESGAGAVSK